VEQEDLDATLGPGDSPEEPGGQDPRVVHDEAVSRPEVGAERVEP
jgi:hypothetical protein